MEDNKLLSRREKHKKCCEAYILANPEKVKKSKEQYKLNNIDKVRKSARDWTARNSDSIRIYQKQRLKNNINARILSKLRTRLYKSTKSQGFRKHLSTSILLGCSIIELRVYLESKFLPRMSWENYGSVWHIDHIIPCSTFNLLDIDQQRACFHYSNLQPLFAVTQIIDGVEYIGNLNKRCKFL